MKVVTKEHYQALLTKCQKGQHKIRQNKFGVSYCVHCGLLSTSGDHKPMQEDDKILVI